MLKIAFHIFLPIVNHLLPLCLIADSCFFNMNSTYGARAIVLAPSFGYIQGLMFWM